MLRAALVIGVTLASVDAWAGGCVACTDASVCGTSGFCVKWSTDPGCGVMFQTCCPGQTPNTGSCIVQNGRPRCEDAGTCMVIGGGSGGGTAGTGGGSSGTGGGSGGTGGGADPGGGCGCGAGAGGAMLLLALAGLVRRRRV